MSPTAERRPRLFGVLCTYNRPQLALHYLDALDRQTLPPDLVVVVDNGSDAALAEAIVRRPPSPTEYVYVAPGANVGPAGAFRAGFEVLLSTARDDDFVAHFDDDDPPVRDDQLELLLTELRARRRSDKRVAAIGLSGGRLDRWTGMVRPSAKDLPCADVDHLHGGYTPIFAFKGLNEVGSHDSSFFYGFEELELGRRLHLAGHRLLVFNSLMAELRSSYPKKARVVTSDQNDLASSWSRFHKNRNLIRVLRREHRWMAIAFTVSVRYLAKPALSCFVHPRAGWHRVVANLRATAAGLRQDGGLDPRYPPPAVHVDAAVGGEA